jgi:uncharacterized membrane protein YuzA (DUF378 family)
VIEVQTKKILHMVAFVLLIVGGVCWGLIGLFDFDLIFKLFGAIDFPIDNIIYTLVGISAVYLAVVHQDECKVCGTK